MPMETAAVGYTPVGFLQMNPTVATPLGPIPTGARIAIINAVGELSWRDDGVAPTATVGMLVATGGTFQYTGNLSALQLISAAAVNISFYR
jgi:hypothetical protein